MTTPARARREPRGGEPKRGGSITYRFSSPPGTYNYLLAADESSLILTFFLLNDHLVTFDPLVQEFRPEIAESWTLGEDGRTLSVTLREGPKFSDGRPISADDVIFTLEAIYDKRTNSPAFRDAMLVNGEEVGNGEGPGPFYRKLFAAYQAAKAASVARGWPRNWRRPACGRLNDR